MLRHHFDEYRIHELRGSGVRHGVDEIVAPVEVAEGVRLDLRGSVRPPGPEPRAYRIVASRILAIDDNDATVRERRCAARELDDGMSEVENTGERPRRISGIRVRRVETLALKRIPPEPTIGEALVEAAYNAAEPIREPGEREKRRNRHGGSNAGALREPRHDHAANRYPSRVDVFAEAARDTHGAQRRALKIDDGKPFERRRHPATAVPRQQRNINVVAALEEYTPKWLELRRSAREAVPQHHHAVGAVAMKHRNRAALGTNPRVPPLRFGGFLELGDGFGVRHSTPFS